MIDKQTQINDQLPAAIDTPKTAAISSSKTTFTSGVVPPLTGIKTKYIFIFALSIIDFHKFTKLNYMVFILIIPRNQENALPQPTSLKKYIFVTKHETKKKHNILNTAVSIYLFNC